MWHTLLLVLLQEGTCRTRRTASSTSSARNRLTARAHKAIQASGLKVSNIGFLHSPWCGVVPVLPQKVAVYGQAISHKVTL
jgi:hypothetical protein